MRSASKRHDTAKALPPVARGRRALSPRAVGVGLRAQAPLPEEEKRGYQVQYILTICEELNAQGDQVELPGLGLVQSTPKSLNAFIAAEFGKQYDIDSLPFDDLLKLRHKLNLRLDELNQFETLAQT